MDETHIHHEDKPEISGRPLQLLSSMIASWFSYFFRSLRRVGLFPESSFAAGSPPSTPGNELDGSSLTTVLGGNKSYNSSVSDIQYGSIKQEINTFFSMTVEPSISASSAAPAAPLWKLGGKNGLFTTNVVCVPNLPFRS